MKSIIYLLIVCLFIQFFTWAYFLIKCINFILYKKRERRNGILPKWISQQSTTNENIPPITTITWHVHVSTAGALVL